METALLFICRSIFTVMFQIYLRSFCLILMANLLKFIITNDTVDNYDWSVWCKFQSNSFNCKENQTGVPRFYYDIHLEDCKSFTYRNCPSVKNSFETITLCHLFCRDEGPKSVTTRNVSEKIFCRYQPDFGSCQEYHPMYYYDLTDRACKGFSYSGCGGNYNRFESHQICTAVCGNVVET